LVVVRDLGLLAIYLYREDRESALRTLDELYGELPEEVKKELEGTVKDMRDFIEAGQWDDAWDKYQVLVDAIGRYDPPHEGQSHELPPRGIGLERGTAREGKERGRGRPLTEEERVMRHREIHGGSGGSGEFVGDKVREAVLDLFSKAVEGAVSAREIMSKLAEIERVEKELSAGRAWTPEAGRARYEELKGRLESLGEEVVKRALLYYMATVDPRVKSVENIFGDPASMLAFVNYVLEEAEKVGVREGLLGPGTEFYYRIFNPNAPSFMEISISAIMCKEELPEAGAVCKALYHIHDWKLGYWSTEDWVRRATLLLSLPADEHFLDPVISAYVPEETYEAYEKAARPEETMSYYARKVLEGERVPATPPDGVRARHRVIAELSSAQHADFEERIRQQLASLGQKADWERELEELTKPVEVDWEKNLRKYQEQQ